MTDERHRSKRQVLDHDLTFILRAARTLVWDLDLKTGIAIRSDTSSELLGIESGSGEDFARIVHPEDRPIVDAAMVRALRGEGAFDVEFRVIRPDGVVLWIHEKGEVVRSPAGEALRLTGVSIDVTNRKLAELSLRESEERLQLAQGAAKIGTWDWDPVTGANRWSPEQYALFGIAPETPVTLELFAGRLHPQDRARVEADVKAALAGERPYDTEFRIQRDDGQRWVLARGRVIRNEAGEPVRMIGINMDVTDRKQAEEALERTQETLRLAIETTRLGIWDYNVETGALLWSDRLKDFYGLPAEAEVTFADFLGGLHPKDRDRVLATYERALQTGGSGRFGFEHRTLSPDGQVRWLLADGRVVFGADGRPVRVVGTALDITDRKNAEEALRDSEERLRLAVASGGFGTWDFDTRSMAGRWSPRAAEMYGFPPDKTTLAYEEWERLVHPEDFRQVDESFRSAMSGQGDYAAEFRVIAPDGSERWIVGRGTALRDARDEIFRIVGINEDITERKQAERLLREANDMLEQRVAERTRELASANEQLRREMAERQAAEEQLRQAEKLNAVGQLTGGVAHDFNNLLTAVLGNLELVEMRLTDEKLRRMIRSAMQAAERGAKLTEQLLAYARKQHLAPKPVDLNAAVSGLAEMLRRTLGGTIDIDLQLARDLWPALVDPTQIELVLLNLAINARDAMPAGGRIVIGTRNVRARDADRPSELASGDYVAVSVADTGTGMTEDVARRAFEPFFTTKEPGKGSGLGLSQVYGVAHQSGGSARIRTKLGRGTVVEVFLPRTLAAQGEMAAAHRVAAAGALASRGVALVVDDQEDVREIAAAHLEELGFAVLQAPGGRAALQLLETAAPAPDLLLVDYAMPDMSGIELARQALARRPQLAVMIMTGYAETSAIEGQVEGSVLVRKPYRLDLLQAKIEEALAARSGRAQKVVPLSPRRS